MTSGAPRGARTRPYGPRYPPAFGRAPGNLAPASSSGPPIQTIQCDDVSQSEPSTVIAPTSKPASYVPVGAAKTMKT